MNKYGYISEDIKGFVFTNGEWLHKYLTQNSNHISLIKWDFVNHGESNEENRKTRYHPRSYEW
jgi:hypothetical protein